MNSRRSLFLYRIQGNENKYKNLILKNYEKIDTIIKENNEEKNFANYISENRKKNSSQFYQDLFVTYHLKDKHNGYFVEFGACDGIRLSNTFYLEKEFGWTGILSEPAKIWHKALLDNRSCIINTDCIAAISGEQIDFSETTRPELSTIYTHLQNDLHSSRRIIKDKYKVHTLTLNDLLEQNDAPLEIDVISIDTEGSEIEILEQFDFQKYTINIIIVEHNYDKKRKEKLKKLLGRQNFKPVFTKISGPDFWFIRN
jgi:FkbM family methyltransferase